MQDVGVGESAAAVPSDEVATVPCVVLMNLGMPQDLERISGLIVDDLVQVHKRFVVQQHVDAERILVVQ